MTTTAPAPTTTTTGVRTLGIISLVLGAASLLFGYTLIVPAAAVILGIIALRTEAASRGFAIAGIVTGAVSLAGLWFGFLGFLAILPFAPLFAIWG
jgi:hypothetical protein